MTRTVPIGRLTLERWKADDRWRCLANPASAIDDVDQEADRIEALSQHGVLQSTYIDLRSFSSEAFLFQRVFENEK